MFGVTLASPLHSNRLLRGLNSTSAWTSLTMLMVSAQASRSDISARTSTNRLVRWGTHCILWYYFPRLYVLSRPPDDNVLRRETTSQVGNKRCLVLEALRLGCVLCNLLQSSIVSMSASFREMIPRLDDAVVRRYSRNTCWQALSNAHCANEVRNDDAVVRQ